MSWSDMLLIVMKPGANRTKSVSRDMTHDGRGFRVSIDFVNEAPVPFSDGAPAPLHAVGEHAILRSEFIRKENGSFKLFKTGKILIDFFDDAVIEGLHVGMLDQLRAGGEGDLLIARPVFEQREIWSDEHSRELALIAHNDGFRDQGIVLQRVLNRLGRDKFAAGGLDEVLLTVGYREEAIGIEVADVSSLKPSVDEGIVGFRGPLPIGLEDGRSTDQNLTVVFNATFDIAQGLAEGAELMGAGRVHRDDRGGLGEAVSFM